MPARVPARTWWLGPTILGVLAVPVLAATTIRPAAPRSLASDDPELTLESGVLHWEGAPFSGRIVERYPDGSIESMTPYQNGLRDGTAMSFFSNGGARWERSYVAGREEGLHRGWYDDGTLHFRYPYAGGVVDGNALEWFPDGTLYRDFNYVGGHEEGSQRMWHDDGTVRANYVVRNGRRYGLMGSKGCVGEGSVSWDPIEENES